MTGCRFQDADQSATLSTVLEIQGDLGHRSVRVYRRLSMQSALPEQGLNLAVLSIACTLHCRSRDQPVQFSPTGSIFTNRFNFHQPVQFSPTGSIFTNRFNFHQPVQFSPTGSIFTNRFNFHQPVQFSPTGSIFTNRFNFHQPVQFSPTGSIFTNRFNFQQQISSTFSKSSF